MNLRKNELNARKQHASCCAVRRNTEKLLTGQTGKIFLWHGRRPIAHQR